MSEAVVEKRSPLLDMSKRLNIDSNILLGVLKKTAFRECRTNEEFISAVIVANMYKLNPLRSEIYAFPASKGGVQPIVSVDGWCKVISGHPEFDGVEFKEIDDKDGNLIAVECTLYRKGFSHPIVVKEYYEEVKRNTEPWRNMKRRMTRHASLKQAGRVGFGITGIYDEDDADRMRTYEGTEQVADMVSLKSAKKVEETDVEETKEKDVSTIGNTEARNIYKTAGKRGIKEQQIKDYIKDKYGISSLGKLSVDDVEDLMGFLNQLASAKGNVDEDLPL